MVARKPDSIRREPTQGLTDDNSTQTSAGVGAAAGAATGAAIGAVGGPVGIVVGASLGGLIGAAAGMAIQLGIEPETEHAYWRQNYRNRAYTDQHEPYERYAPAYQYGWESYSRYALPRGRRRTFEEVEQQLGRDWESHRGPQDLTWDAARHATRDAWERVHGTLAEVRDRVGQADLRIQRDSRH